MTVDNNQQNNGKGSREQIDQFPVDGQQHPNAPKQRSFLERLFGIFADNAKRFGRDHVSPHAKGRQRPPTWRKKRKARQQMAKESRRRNRGRSQKGK